jgi:hypothetical protein
MCLPPMPMTPGTACPFSLRLATLSRKPWEQTLRRPLSKIIHAPSSLDSRFPTLQSPPYEADLQVASAFPVIRVRFTAEPGRTRAMYYAQDRG